MDSSLTLQQVLTKRKYSIPKGYSDWDCIYQKMSRGFCGIKLKHITLQRLNEAISQSKDEIKECGGDLFSIMIVNGLFQMSKILFEHPPVFVLKNDLFEAFSCSRLPQTPVISHSFAKVGVIFFPLNNILSVDFAVFRAVDDNISVYCFRSDGKLAIMDFPIGISLTELNDILISPSTKEYQRWNEPKSLKDGFRTLKDVIAQIFLYKSAYPSAELTYEQQARHGLIVPDKRRGVMGYNTKKLSPIIIGENYRIKRERVEATGTHASPQAHWRSGHWRQQPIGKRENPEYKTIWIEPVLVNG